MSGWWLVAAVALAWWVLAILVAFWVGPRLKANRVRLERQDRELIEAVNAMGKVTDNTITAKMVIDGLPDSIRGDFECPHQVMWPLQITNGAVYVYRCAYCGERIPAPAAIQIAWDTGARLEGQPVITPPRSGFSVTEPEPWLAGDADKLRTMITRRRIS